MKKRLSNIILKKIKPICVFVPNDIRLSFYIAPMGDVSSKQDFTAQDLNSIMLLNSKKEVNPSLFDQSIKVDESTIYRLLDEGVLKNQPTGADLGIYNYKPIESNNKSFDYSKYINKNFVQSFDTLDQDIEEETFSFTDDEFDNGYCLLAEEDPLQGEQTKVVRTFKGYLEVTTSEFSTIRKCNYDNDDIAEVYIPQEYIHKYQLRNGDEIMCTCKESNGNMLMSSLFTINQISRVKWDIDRPWFNNLKNIAPTTINAGGDYIQTIANKFRLFCGDNVFLYLNKSSQKNQILSNIFDELSEVFDKVVYINTKYNPTTKVSDNYNVVKFCALFTEESENKIAIALLGANYAKRMIELGKRVAVIIDDVESIMTLDKQHYGDEMPISKTILSSAKVSTIGSGTTFSVISLRTQEISAYEMNSMFKLAETLGIVFENNEIDLFNSYRV